MNQRTRATATMRASTIRQTRLLFLFFMLLIGSLAHAQSLPEAKMDRGSAELVFEGTTRPGSSVMAAIDFKPVEGWHGYWSNPGDAGQGLMLSWNLPEGWKAGAPQFPVPQKLLVANLMNHVFEGEHAVLIPFEIPPSAKVGESYPVSVRADWLTCSDTLCVPQWATLRAVVRVSDKAEVTEPRFAKWRAAIAPPLDQAGRFETRAGNLRIAIPLPAAMEPAAPHVFIEQVRIVDYAASQSFYRDGDTIIVEIPLKEGGDEPPPIISGIFSFGEFGFRFEAEAGEVPTGGVRIMAGSESETPSLWVLLFGALAGGLLLNIMPCVFPILSIKALALARAGESQAQARREGIAYTAGVVLACVGLGALILALRAAGEQVGWAFQLQNPGVVVALMLLAVAITANFAGVFELPSLSFTRKGAPASAFATGLLAAFVATPCTGPFMAVALGAALLLPPLEALVLFAALGFGLALPFLLIGLVPRLRAMLPKPGPWMERFRKAMAFPMGLTALALIWLTARLGGKGFALVALVVVVGLMIALMVVGRLQRSGKMAWPAFGLIAAPFLIFGLFALPASYDANAQASRDTIIETVPFSRDALADARASGQPVFLWFTADWCVTCKVNESVAIEREVTREAFERAGVVAMVGDWTRPDPEITTFLNEQGAAGVPLYLWYEPGTDGEQLPQVLTSDMLVERAKR